MDFTKKTGMIYVKLKVSFLKVDFHAASQEVSGFYMKPLLNLFCTCCKLFLENQSIMSPNMPEQSNWHTSLHELYI